VITGVVLIFLLVFVIWPDSRLKFESAFHRRLPRLFYLTFHSIQRYQADVDNRFPHQPQRKQL
jgi:hypothetical protein